MATKKISQLTETSSVADNDYIAILQTSTTATKKIQRSNFLAGVSPAGILAPYAGSSVPTGWLLCNGQAVSRSTYAALFAVIGVVYGVGDNSTTFNIPNLKGKSVVGLTNTDSDFNTLGNSGGEKNHTLITAETPYHSHGVNDPGHSHGVTRDIAQTYGGNQRLQLNGTAQALTFGGSPIAGATTGISLSSTGGDQAHNNMHPYLILNYIIKT